VDLRQRERKTKKLMTGTIGIRSTSSEDSPITCSAVTGQPVSAKAAKENELDKHMMITCSDNIPVVQAKEVAEVILIQSEGGISSSGGYTLVSAYPISTTVDASNGISKQDGITDGIHNMHAADISDRNTTPSDKEGGLRQVHPLRAIPDTQTVSLVSAVQCSTGEISVSGTSAVPIRPIPVRHTQRPDAVEIERSSTELSVVTTGSLTNSSPPVDATNRSLCDVRKTSAGDAGTTFQDSTNRCSSQVEQQNGALRHNAVLSSSLLGSTLPFMDQEADDSTRKRPRLDDSVWAHHYATTEQQAAAAAAEPAVKAAAAAAAAATPAAAAAAAADFSGQQMVEVQQLQAVRNMEMALCAQYERYLTILRCVPREALSNLNHAQKACGDERKQHPYAKKCNTRKHAVWGSN
jgi:hypothetical protein